jgi:hypothetical protein
VPGTAVGERQINAAVIGPAIEPKRKTSRVIQNSQENAEKSAGRCLRNVIVAEW